MAVMVIAIMIINAILFGSRESVFSCKSSLITLDKIRKI